MKVNIRDCFIIMILWHSWETKTSTGFLIVQSEISFVIPLPISVLSCFVFLEVIFFSFFSLPIRRWFFDRISNVGMTSTLFLLCNLYSTFCFCAVHIQFFPLRDEAFAGYWMRHQFWCPIVKNSTFAWKLTKSEVDLRSNLRNRTITSFPLPFPLLRLVFCGLKA